MMSAINVARKIGLIASIVICAIGVIGFCADVHSPSEFVGCICTATALWAVSG